MVARTTSAGSEKWEDYIGSLTKEGKLKSAQPLVTEGKILSGSRGVWKEGPFNETQEVIVVYYHILAKDLNEAIAIAKGNPEFKYGTTARIEVRPIKIKEESTGYVYLNGALKREVSVLPILYNCGFFYVLWVTYDVTWGDL